MQTSHNLVNKVKTIIQTSPSLVDKVDTHADVTQPSE